MLTEQNVASNMKSYSGEEECDLAHTDVEKPWPLAHEPVMASDSKCGHDDTDNIIQSTSLTSHYPGVCSCAWRVC